MKISKDQKHAYMRQAIREARKNLRRPKGGPFGACLIRDGRILAVTRNTVLDADATCHAEINAIRLASRRMKTYDLSGCVIFSTTEPCPMCFSAIHWARIQGVYYGTTIQDVRKLGFNELMLSACTMKARGNSSVRIFPGFMRDECRQLLKDWSTQQQIVY